MRAKTAKPEKIWQNANKNSKMRANMAHRGKNGKMRAKLAKCKLQQQNAR